MIARRLLSAGPWPWILLSMLDRAILLIVFASRYVSTDDVIIWHGAMDFAHGHFHGPYFYGQSYGPMLEALVAAPFVRLVPMNVLMPSVSSALALLPYWSFALWHRRQGNPMAAVFFAAIPLLMPVEFGLMTTVSRGFVTGAAVLAPLPWLMVMRNPYTRSISIGATISIAWFVNPNSLVFSIGYLVYYLLASDRKIMHSVLTCLGATTGLSAHAAAQYWCHVHPDRIVHHLIDPQPHFDPGRIMASLTNLDAHFRWLMPVIWPYGGLLGVWLVLLIALSLIRKDRHLAIALSVGALAICVSFTMDKVHDGWDSAFFPLSRMFLCLPLLVCWATAKLIGTRRSSTAFAAGVFAASLGAVTYRSITTTDIAQRQVRDQTKWVFVSPLPRLKDDARRLKAISDRYHIGLIVPLGLPSEIAPQFRTYLQPILEPASPPTYVVGYERRYWHRETFGPLVFENVLFTGGMPERWAPIIARDRRFVEIMDGGVDAVHVLTGNTVATDSLVFPLMHELHPPGE